MCQSQDSRPQSGVLATTCLLGLLFCLQEISYFFALFSLLFWLLLCSHALKQRYTAIMCELCILKNKDFLNFESTVKSRAIVRNNTERTYIPFIQFNLLVTSSKMTGQYHNQGINIDMRHRIAPTTLLQPHPLPFNPP